MTETSHLMPSTFSGDLAFDPVVFGVAQGLSQLFPPVAHPDGMSTDDATGQESDEMNPSA